MTYLFLQLTVFLQSSVFYVALTDFYIIAKFTFMYTQMNLFGNEVIFTEECLFSRHMFT